MPWEFSPFDWDDANATGFDTNGYQRAMKWCDQRGISYDHNQWNSTIIIHDPADAVRFIQGFLTLEKSRSAGWMSQFFEDAKKRFAEATAVPDDLLGS